ncbi:MAG: hypothetical protein ACYTG7_17780 [Planctomycetota bacterium]
MMILVVVALVVLSGIMMSSLQVFDKTEKIMDFELNYHGQAVNAAKAGLIDALSWFRRQTSQPVKVFEPVLDLGIMPPIDETDDPNIGLVREYLVSQRDNLFERYEVRKRRILPANPPKRLYDTIIGVHDITNNQPGQEPGDPNSVERFWYIEAKGFIFEAIDPTTYTPDQFYLFSEFVEIGPDNWDSDSNNELNEQINLNAVRVLASATMSTQFRRLSVIPPANAAICAYRGDWVTLDNKSRVTGGSEGTGLVYTAGTGSHSEIGSAELDSWSTALPANYSLDMVNVFGVNQQELKILCDSYIDVATTPVPDEFPDYSLIYLDGDVSFGPGQPIRGTAIVYIDGNFIIDSDPWNSFSGILYVEGDYAQYAPSQVFGTVIVKGSVWIGGSGDISTITYDPEVRQRILQISGQYRFSSPTHVIQAGN